MIWGMIGTWRMALEGMARASEPLKQGGSIVDALECAICEVEDCPRYISVGTGGLPNAEGVLELDAAFMDGDTLSIGAVAAVKGYRHPVSIACRLMSEPVNNMLVAEGAQRYAAERGFERAELLTPEARRRWTEASLKRAEEARISGLEILNPYDGHDTVGIVGVDSTGRMAAATSTSGLFMKHSGRVGDSPLPGSGLYADSAVGAAAATGLGEDIMKGSLCYETVRLMGTGCSPSEAAQRAVSELHQRLLQRRGRAGDMSVVCMNAKGEWGVATNAKSFSFVVALPGQSEPAVYIARAVDGSTCYEPATQAWIQTHTE